MCLFFWEGDLSSWLFIIFFGEDMALLLWGVHGTGTGRTVKVKLVKKF